jgi:hypothetical protein
VKADPRVVAFVNGRGSSDPDHPDAEREAPGPAPFQRLDEGSYRLTLEALGVEFTVDRLRRKWDELVGEVTVRCTLPGAQTFGGVLSVADLNLSSQRGRQERAGYLRERSRADDLDWSGLVEEFVQRVLTAERTGEPSILLRDLPRPKPDDVLIVDGFPLLARHPVIAFGDGGAAKSYLGLYCAGKLVQAGHRVGLFDWELAGEDHRDRLERLFGPDMPAVRYARCTRPLVHETDRLRRIVRDDRLDYAILDSVAFACDGPPEAAEVAGRYFQSVRQFGTIGTLHVAHVSKADGADQKPFGSAFWHNGARATWFVKLAEATPGGETISIGLYNRKANLGPVRPAAGFEITFAEARTTFRRINVADTPDLAGGLSIRQRMAYLLRRGAMSPEDLAVETASNVETVKRTLRRYSKQFTLIPGGNYGLAEFKK